MVEIVWTEPALSDLDAIADYIALDKPDAAREFVRRVFAHVEQLIDHPDSGSKIPEFTGSRYRQLVETPCRVFYRKDGDTIYILYVMRGERQFRKSTLSKREPVGRSRT